MIYKSFIACCMLLFSTCTVLHAQKITEYTPMDILDINSEEYGEGIGIGFTLFGDGIGLLVRKALKNEDQIGLGTHFYTSLILNSSGTQIERVSPGIFFRGEYNFHLGNTFKEKVKRSYVKRKFRKHYLSAKAGVGLSEINVYSFVLSWHRETFRVKNNMHARGLDLGVIYNLIPNNAEDLFRAGVGVYLRLDWTWFRQNK